MKSYSRIVLAFIWIIIMLSMCSNKYPDVDKVYEEILCNEIKFPEIVLAQSINECGWFYESYNAEKRNNLFGMTGGKKTDTNKHGYKIFDHWTESVYDYKLWQDRNYKDGMDYFLFLKWIGYASSEEYESDLKFILRVLQREGVISKCKL